jgi:hypothetical protein
MADAPLTVPDTRLMRVLIRGLGGGIVAGISGFGVYLGLRQAYLAGLILMKPGVSLGSHVGNPVATFWLLIVVSVILPIAFGSLGLYATYTRKLWSGIEFRAPAGKGGGD